MLEELLQHFEGHRGDIRAHTRRFDDVNGTTNARREHFRFPFVVTIDFNYVGEQFETVLPRVVEATEEGADVGRARFGCEYGLRCGEAERDVDTDAFRS